MCPPPPHTVALLALLALLGLLAYKLRKKPFMQRILAPFRRREAAAANDDDDQGSKPTGPYYNIEKSAAAAVAGGGATTAQAQPTTMTEQALLVGAKGQNSFVAAAANTPNQQGGLSRKPVGHLTVSTRNLAPSSRPTSTNPRRPHANPLGISPVSPLPPPSSHHPQPSSSSSTAAAAAAAEVSPITASPTSQRSSFRASPFHMLSPPPPAPVSAPPEPPAAAAGGNKGGQQQQQQQAGQQAIKIAGSEARIVQIPPRSSRATLSSVGSGSGGTLARSWSAASRSDSRGSAESRGGDNKYYTQQQQQQQIQPAATVLPLYARPPVVDKIPGNNGMAGGASYYRPYHPSLGDIAIAPQQEGVRRHYDHHHEDDSSSSSRRASNASETSIASSGIILPDAIAWPMPPGTPTTMSDRHSRV